MTFKIKNSDAWQTGDFYQSISLICERFNIGEILSEPKKLSGGCLHQMWCLSTNVGNFALKKVNEQNWSLLDQTILPVNLAENLARHHQERGLLTRVALKSSANNHLERCDQGHAWMLFPWIEGTMKEPSSITHADAETIGQLLKKIQLSAPKLSGLKCPTHWFGYSETHWTRLIQEAEKKSLPWAIIAKANQKILNDWSNAAAKVAPALQKNLITSHRDLSFSNIIWRPDHRPVVIDWEYAGLVNPESEIFNTAMTWSYRGETTFDLEAIEAFIEGAQTKLTLDRSSLQAGFAGYLLEWCEFNMQRSLLESTTGAEVEVVNVIRILKDSNNYIF